MGKSNKRPASLKSSRDPEGGVPHQRVHPLDAIFEPASVAVIGATEAASSVGRAIMENLGCFKRPVYPVNPKRASILGRKAYPTVTDLPAVPDVAIIATPAPTVPGIIRDCAKMGVPGAVILSAGFKEVGEEGRQLEREIMKSARAGQMRIVGPNCLGVMTPHQEFNATFAAGMAQRGHVAFISQSGALCTAILDWSFKENVGFSSFISIGSMMDVGWGDLIGYLGDDPQTRSIVMYMESIGDAQGFLSAAREVASTKPIIVIKVGRTAAAAQAAASHTGSLTGSDEVLDAAFRRAGVLRVQTIGELFQMADLLAKQPRPRGPRLSIVTNAGGPAALSTDMLISNGGQLAKLAPETLQSLNEFLPAAWSHGNPVDILGDASADRYIRAVELAANDPGSDGLLVILTPQKMTENNATARKLAEMPRPEGKPLLASWMGGRSGEVGEEVMSAAGIPVYRYPDTAARSFALMWRYSDNLRVLYECPTVVDPNEVKAVSHSSLDDDDPVGHSLKSRPAADKIVQRVRKTHRRILTEYESKQVLAAYDIPIVETRITPTEDEAVAAAHELGFPVVLKLWSETITHKTDVGGVQLNLRTERGVRRAWRNIKKAVTAKAGAEHFLGATVQPMVSLEGYELIVGSSIDPQFGPVMLFGAGGQLVEVFKDRALGLPPLNLNLARRLIEQTKVYTALQGTRGRLPVDLHGLQRLLVRFSHLLVEQPWIAEIDINPLLASPEGFVALDARVVLHETATPEHELPRPAIRPYPTQYIASWKLKSGVPVAVRPIRPEDEPLMVRFHGTLSERSVYQRYFFPLKLEQRIAHERLARLCFIDYDREMALIAVGPDPESGRRQIFGVGRLSKVPGLREAEFALLLSDRWQGQGIGTRLLEMLVQVGRDEGLERIFADILRDNHDMQDLCRRAGFNVTFPTGTSVCHAEIVLKNASRRNAG